MIEHLNSIAGLWWGWLLAVSWQVGLLIVFVACLDRLVRRWAWPQLRYALWSLVLIKLILPPALSLPSGVVPELRPVVEQTLSRMRVQKSGGEEGSAGISDFGFRIGDSVLETGAGSLMVTPLSRTEVCFSDGASPSRQGHPQAALEAAALAASPQSATANPQLEWQAYAMIVWLSGTLILGIWLLVRLRSFIGQDGFQAATASLPQSFYNRMVDCAKRLGLRRVPRVVVTRRVPTPAVFGVFRPVLLMPKGYLRRLSRKDTEHMLLHELAHIKRGDLLMHSLYMLLQIVHWYNPLLWLVRRQLHHLRELSCDATVAELLREQTPAYRQTLLETARRLLATSAEPGLGLLGLFEDSNRLAVRLNWLARPTWRYKTMKRVFAVILVSLMFVCVLPMAPTQGQIVVEEKTEPKSEQKQAETPSAEEVKALQAKLEKLEIERRKLQKELQALAQARQGTQQTAATQARMQAARAAAQSAAQARAAQAGSMAGEAAQARMQAARAAAQAAAARIQAEKAKAKAKRVQVYTIQPGDTLASIAEKFYGKGNGATPENVARIIKANKLDGADGIRVGQKLAIPLGRDAGDPERVVVMPAPPKGAPQPPQPSAWSQPGAEKQWQDWAQQMEAWGEQMEQWEQGEAMQQWQADLEQWENGPAMKQWEKDVEKWAEKQAKASEKVGEGLNSLPSAPLSPMPMMPPMPAMPTMPAPPAGPGEMVAPTVPAVAATPAAPQPMPRPVPRAMPREVIVPKVKPPKVKVPKVQAAPQQRGERLMPGSEESPWIEATSEGEYILKSLGSDSTCELVNLLGSVHVTAGEGANGTVKAIIKAKGLSEQEAQEIAEKVEIRIAPNGNKVKIDAKLPDDIEKDRREKIQVRFEAVLPAGVEVRVTQKVGDVHLSGFEGDVKAVAEVGSIYATNLGGSVYCRTNVGNVEMRTPADVSAKVKASAQIGAITSDLPLKVTGASVVQAGKVRSALGSTAAGVLGAGDDTIHLAVNVGSINIQSNHTPRDPLAL